jgi:hypothetical protein
LIVASFSIVRLSEAERKVVDGKALRPFRRAPKRVAVCAAVIVAALVYAWLQYRPVLGTVTAIEAVLLILACAFDGWATTAAVTSFLVMFLPLVAVVFGFAEFAYWGFLHANEGYSLPKSRPVAPISLPLGTDTYVSFGDSYSAGQGLAPYVPATDEARIVGDHNVGGNLCHRSQNYSYPAFLTFASEATKVFRACSGAKVADMDGPQVTLKSEGLSVSAEKQLGPGVLNARVGLVTVTIGGNDLGFSEVLTQCVGHPFGCLGQPFNDKAVTGRNSGLTLRAWVASNLRVLDTHLVSFYREIRSSAPRARIVVLGYPPLVGDNRLLGTEFDMTGSKDCLIGLSLLSKPDIVWLEHKLNSTIREAAARAGVDYVDTTHVYSGHEACGSKLPRYIEFPRISLRSGGLDVGTFHPTRWGQYVLARTVECYLHLVPIPRGQYNDDALWQCARENRLPPNRTATRSNRIGVGFRYEMPA